MRLNECKRESPLLYVNLKVVDFKVMLDFFLILNYHLIDAKPDNL